MLFSEVYSAYFNTVAAIVTEALYGEITEKRVLQIIGEKAFSESMLSIIPAIKNEKWLVINRTLQTPVKNPPKMPLTILQKRWLKALLSDPRITLFAPDMNMLYDVKPLFEYSDFVFFDRYADGDPYDNKDYIVHFQTILTGLKEKRTIHIKYKSRYGKKIYGRFIPYRIEYSAKDDKFRLVTAGGRYAAHINIARITECRLLEPYHDLYLPTRKECSVTFTLNDERNALDRVMLHFSDCRKETRRISDSTYQVMLWYEEHDETEMLIRILSFGPMIKVTAPENFIKLIKERISMQNEFATFFP